MLNGQEDATCVKQFYSIQFCPCYLIPTVDPVVPQRFNNSKIHLLFGNLAKHFILPEISKAREQNFKFFRYMFYVESTLVDASGDCMD